MNNCDHSFIEDKVLNLLDRFSFSYYPKETFNYYFIRIKGYDEIISKELMLTLNLFSNEIHVSKFYPEIYHQPDCKYLSAACFYLLINHFFHQKLINNDFSISLYSKARVFEDFYSRLLDFDFINTGSAPGKTISALSRYDYSGLNSISKIYLEDACENDFFYI